MVLPALLLGALAPTVKLVQPTPVTCGMACCEASGVCYCEEHYANDLRSESRAERNDAPFVTLEAAKLRPAYEANCAACHGSDGKGTEFNKTAKVKAPDLKSHYTMGLADGEIFYVITNGIKTSKLPAYKLKASDRERWQLVHYVKHLGMNEDEHAAMTGAAGATQDVALRFKPVVGDKSFACGQSYEGIGTPASKITPTDFRFYVRNGQACAVTSFNFGRRTCGAVRVSFLLITFPLAVPQSILRLAGVPWSVVTRPGFFQKTACYIERIVLGLSYAKKRAMKTTRSALLSNRYTTKLWPWPSV